MTGRKPNHGLSTDLSKLERAMTVGRLLGNHKSRRIHFRMPAQTPPLVGISFLWAFRRPTFPSCPGVPGSKGPFLTWEALGARGSFVLSLLFQGESSAYSCCPLPTEGPHHRKGEQGPGNLDAKALGGRVEA